MPNPKGALQWIKETMSPEFFARAKEAIGLAKATGNEHAVTQGYKGWISPVASGDRYSVDPIYPKYRGKYFELPTEIEALLHTHPKDPDFGITVAPSRQDLEMVYRNSRNNPVRKLIVSPDKDTFVDYHIPEEFDSTKWDKLYYELMKHTQGNLAGVEPIKPDVYTSALRRMAENPASGYRYIQELGDETPYADEVYKTLKRLGMKKGGLVRMKECGCGKA